MHSRPQLCEPTLTYDPPYDRVVDDQLAWLLVRFLHPGSELHHREEVDTGVGRFVLDFLIQRGDRRIGLVVMDEEEGVEGRPADGYWHSLVVATGRLEALYVLDGRGLTPHLVDVLAVVAGWQPELFCPDGLVELSKRASDLGRTCVLNGSGTEVRLTYREYLADEYGGEQFEWPEPETTHVVVHRRPGATPPLARVA